MAQSCPTCIRAYAEFITEQAEAKVAFRKATEGPRKRLNGRIRRALHRLNKTEGEHPHTKGA